MDPLEEFFKEKSIVANVGELGIRMREKVDGVRPLSELVESKEFVFDAPVLYSHGYYEIADYAFQRDSKLVEYNFKEKTLDKVTVQCDFYKL